MNIQTQSKAEKDDSLKKEEDGDKKDEMDIVKESKTEETAEKEQVNEDKEPAKHIPQPLHKTQSIFLRNLIPAITRNEVVSVCRRYPGFMRVCIQDPQPERRFVRRGWITFDRTVNVKDICWNLNNLRVGWLSFFIFCTLLGTFLCNV